MADPVTPNPNLSQGSTKDVLQNRGRSLDDQIDRMTAPAGNEPAPAPAPKPAPQESTHNPANKLPESEGVFHRIARGFGLTK